MHHLFVCNRVSAGAVAAIPAAVAAVRMVHLVPLMLHTAVCAAAAEFGSGRVSFPVGRVPMEQRRLRGQRRAGVRATREGVLALLHQPLDLRLGNERNKQQGLRGDAEAGNRLLIC